MNVVNASRCHCLSLVKRASKFDPDCCSYDDLIAFICTSQERSRGPARFQDGNLIAHNFEVYCLTHLRQWAVAFLAPQTGSSTTTIVSLHKSTERVRRVPDKPRKNNALAVDFVAKLLLQHTHVSSREALDFGLFSTIVLSPRLTRTASTSAWMAGSLSALSNASLRPQVSGYASTQSIAQSSGHLQST